MAKELQKRYSMDEIDNMPAGPEMDDLVAEIMGLKKGIDFGNFDKHEWVRADDTWADYTTFRCQRCHQLSGWVSEDELEPGPCCITPPPYSTEDNHAFEIVDWLAKKGHSIRVITYANEHHCQIFELDDTWEPNNFVSQTFKWINGGEGETRPLAICRALLKFFVQSHWK